MPKRTDGLYKRGPRWYFKYKTEDGDWKDHATGTSDYKEAKDKKAQFLSDLKQNKLPNERGNWTLKQAVEAWKTSRKLRLQPGSYASEVSICANLVANLKQETKLKNLTTAFARYQDRRLEDEASHKTINNETTVLSAMLKAANLQVTYKKLKLEENEDIVPFSPEEQQRLVQYARVSDENAVVPYAAVLALATGMRGGEIKKLQLIVLGVVAGLPYWWYSSGRDMQTFHDGLSTQFRISLARILNADGYEAKNEFYDQSVTVTERDNLLKYGIREPGQFKESELLNYIRWEGRTESEKKIFDTINELTTESGYTYPEHRKYLDDAKKRMRERIANMQAAHSMAEICREAVVKMVQDKTIESDSRCVTVPTK